MGRDLGLQLGVKSFLKPDAVPTVDVANEAPKISDEMSDRDRRQVSEDLGPLAYFLVCCSFTFRPMSILEPICSELFFLLSIFFFFADCSKCYYNPEIYPNNDIRHWR